MDLLLLFVSSIFIHNILLSRFLGCCPFMGVSTKLETARGMGLAVVFVILLSSLMTWLVYHYVLVPLHLEYLYTLSFILVIAALVQFVELTLNVQNIGGKLVQLCIYRLHGYKLLPFCSFPPFAHFQFICILHKIGRAHV